MSNHNLALTEHAAASVPISGPDNSTHWVNNSYMNGVIWSHLSLLLGP